MDSRAQGLHACAERLCSFFAALALELEEHEEREAKIDESGEQRVRGSGRFSLILGLRWMGAFPSAFFALPRLYFHAFWGLSLVRQL